jgi:hypothetical protein
MSAGRPELCSSRFPRCDLPIVERAHEARYLIAMVFQSEVPRVEHVQFSVLHIALERASPLLGEDRVICAPHQERRWLILAEILVPARILFNVCPIFIEQIELDAVILGAAQKEQVRSPIVWTDFFGVARAFAVNPFHEVGGEEAGEWRLSFRSAVLPEGHPQGVPHAGEPFFVGVPVLGNDPFNPIGMAHGDAEPTGEP